MQLARFLDCSHIACSLRRKSLKTAFFVTCLVTFLGPIGGLGGHQHMNADEIAGLGLGAAALIGGIGYLFLRRRNDS